MVSSTNLATSAILLFGMISVISFMKSQRMDSDEYTLVQACRIAEGHSVVSAHECDTFEEKMFEWDSQIACQAGFKMGEYFWTPKMVFDLVDANGNMTFGAGLTIVTDKICKHVQSDPDYQGWLVRRKEGRLEKRDLFIDGGFKLFGALRGLATALFWPLYWAGKNYRACSGELLWNVIMGGREIWSDNAQCARCFDQQKWNCKKRHGSGEDGYWYRHSNDRKNYLNNGCVDHDDCLNRNFNAGGPRNECDGKLVDAARQCTKGGWRGCRDAQTFSWIVWTAMKIGPNKDSSKDGPGARTGDCRDYRRLRL